MTDPFASWGNIAGLVILVVVLLIVINRKQIREWLDREVECRHERESLYRPDTEAARLTAEVYGDKQMYPDPATTRWPDVCADPPCDHEDGWVCTNHQARGKHHAVWQGSLDNQPADVILAVITEVQNRKKP